MHDIAELVLSWVVTTALTFGIIILDERRMKPERLERAWPPTSRDAAIIGFGPLALLVHFLKTRGGFTTWQRFFLGIPLGLLLGVGSVIALSLVGTVLVNVTLRILGYPVDWSFE